jgi:hypothetical protein
VKVALVIDALLHHILVPLWFVLGVWSIHEGWGRDPLQFALGILFLPATAVLVWRTVYALDKAKSA